MVKSRLRVLLSDLDSLPYIKILYLTQLQTTVDGKSNTAKMKTLIFFGVEKKVGGEGEREKMLVTSLVFFFSY